MGSLMEELRRREEAARAEADGLRARIEELSADLARAQEQVARLVITREEVTRVLEEPPAADAAPREGGSGGKPGPGSPIGAMTVPPWQEGAEASVLPRSYQDLAEVAEDAGRPLRAAEFAVATGQGTEKAKVEGLRSKLKLLASAGLAGWLPRSRMPNLPVAGRRRRSRGARGLIAGVSWMRGAAAVRAGRRASGTDCATGRAFGRTSKIEMISTR
jgi:hypothetical protein